MPLNFDTIIIYAMKLKHSFYHKVFWIAVMINADICHCKGYYEFER